MRIKREFISWKMIRRYVKLLLLLIFYAFLCRMFVNQTELYGTELTIE